MTGEQQDMFGEPARARRDDPETSKEAAQEINAKPAKMTRRRRAVYKVYEGAAKYPESESGKGMTDEDMITTYMDLVYMMPEVFPMQSMSGLRTRRSELVGMGLIEFTGEYGKTKSGRRARKWALKKK